MKILIDYTQIPIQKVGVGIYALNLISKIQELDKVNKYLILAQDDDLDILGMNNNLIKIKGCYFRHFALRFLLEQFYIPYLIIKHKINVVHSLHYSFPLIACTKKVVTIHDLTFFKFPESHLCIKRCYFRLFIMLSSIFVDRVITDSKSTLDDFLKKFYMDKNKTSVVHLGKSDVFNSNLLSSRIDFVKQKNGINKEYFLYLGTIEPRKNIKSIILSFNEYLKINKSFQLVIAGKKGWFFNDVFDLVEGLQLQEYVIFTGFVNEQDKPYLISGAKIFIYLSLYEGFGIPVLEAMACGIPTITSNISSLPEVAGDAALLVNPLSVDEIYHGIKRLLSDKELYAELKQKSIKQANKFSWENTAKKTIEVYNSLS